MRLQLRHVEARQGANEADAVIVVGDARARQPARRTDENRRRQHAPAAHARDHPRMKEKKRSGRSSKRSTPPHAGQWNSGGASLIAGEIAEVCSTRSLSRPHDSQAYGAENDSTLPWPIMSATMLHCLM